MSYQNHKPEDPSSRRLEKRSAGSRFVQTTLLPAFAATCKIETSSSSKMHQSTNHNFMFIRGWPPPHYIPTNSWCLSLGCCWNLHMMDHNEPLLTQSAVVWELGSPQFLPQSTEQVHQIRDIICRWQRRWDSTVICKLGLACCKIIAMYHFQLSSYKSKEPQS